MSTVNLNKVFSFYEEIPLSSAIEPLISKNEIVQFAVKTIRDIAVFTNKRILIADKQGLTGKKIEYYSIPFKNIITYAIETAGTFDLDSEIKLLMSGGISIELRFFKSKKMDNLLFKVYHLLNDFVIG